MAERSTERVGPVLLETETLIARTKAGDLDARNALFERYRRPLERFLHARLVPSARRLAETQDLVQEVCTRALASLDQLDYRGPGSFWAYLRRIGLNYAAEISGRGRPRIRSEALPEDSAQALPGRELDPLSVLVSRERIEMFEKALDSLRDQHRDALLMRLELELDHRSIAEACGFPSAAAARMAVCRAVERVAKEMSRGGHGH